jgi:hypothetical protein
MTEMFTLIALQPTISRSKSFSHRAIATHDWRTLINLTYDALELKF